MKNSKTMIAAWVAAAAGVASALPEWSGASLTGNNWSDAANWAYFDRPDSDGDDFVTFYSGSARLSPNVNQNYSVYAVEFDRFFGSASSYSITGTGTLGITGRIQNHMSSSHSISAPIRLDGDATFRNYDDSTSRGALTFGAVSLNFKTLYVASSTNGLTINGPITGNGGIVHYGPGTLRVGGSGVYQGDIWLTGGTFEFGAGVNLGSVSNVIRFHATDASGAATLRRTTTGGVALNMTLGGLGGTIATPAGTTTTFLGAIGDNGGTSASSLYKTESGTAVLQGALSYKGSTIVQAGTLRIETATLPQTPVQVNSGATLELMGGVHLVSSVSNAGLINLANGAELATGIEVFGAGGAIDSSGTITGLTGRLTKRGTQAGYLRSANTYGGGTVVGAGTLFVKNTVDSATGTGPVTVLNPNTTLAGDGRIAGAITLDAGTILAPGDPTGTLRTANVTFADRAMLRSRLGGVTKIGQLDSSGVVNLGSSTLWIERLNNYTPAAGVRLEILRAADIVGLFGAIAGMDFGQADRRLAVLYEFGPSDRVVVRNSLIGDANTDDAVDFSDLILLARNFGLLSGRTWADGDFNGNGSTDFDDLIGLARSYNTPGTFDSDWTFARSIVPEPATLAAILLPACLLLRRR